MALPSFKFGVLYRKLHALKEGSAIVYVRNRKKTQVIAEWLQSVGISATFYHAGLDAKTRDERQDSWMMGRVKVMAATNAFGMGIDKPDVRLVIQMDLPDCIEAYFQEAGRAGRDLKPAEAFLLVSNADIQQLKDNLLQSFPEMDRIKMIYRALGNYLQLPLGAGKMELYPFVMADFAKTYGFSVMEVFSALKIMEKEGLLELSDSFDEPSKVWIKAPREDLYRFQVAFPKYDTFIKYMLRNLPGVLSDFVKFNEEVAAQKTGMTVDQVTEQLRQMEKYNFLTYVPRKDKPQIMLLTELLDTRYFTLSNENYQDRKRDAQERVGAVIDFVNNNQECRSVQLLRYFNETTEKTCGRCDVCLSHTEHQLGASEYEAIQQILVTELRKRSLSVREAIEVCEGYDEEEVIEAIRWMVDNAVLKMDGDVLGL